MERVVTVFGSAVVRVEPDVMSLRLAVSRQGPRPRDVIRETQQAAQIVRTLLGKAGVTDVAASRLILAQVAEGPGQARGFAARIGFTAVMPDLSRTEEVLIGVVDAGANEIGAVEFHTSRWAELRAEARRRAVDAARAAAEAYARAAGVGLGSVVGIADQAVGPDPADDGHPTTALAPDAIPVAARVAVTFELV
ncbi:MAG: hypothetical protein C0501_16170 [Isosphaera sp.]|nr:hypothetical protein [Isosphaera sp.]